MLILEVVAGISAYALQGPIVNVISDKINYTMQYYDSDKDAQTAVDFLQSKVRFKNALTIISNFQMANLLT